MQNSDPNVRVLYACSLYADTLEPVVGKEGRRDGKKKEEEKKKGKGKRKEKEPRGKKRGKRGEKEEKEEKEEKGVPQQCPYSSWYFG